MSISRRKFVVGAAAVSASPIVPSFAIAPPTKNDDEIITDGIRAVFTQARRLVALPENWLQGDGYEYKIGGTEKFSIEGAINISFVRYMYPAARVSDFWHLYSAYQDPHDWLIREATDKVIDGVIHQHWPPYKRRWPWNDDPNRQHADILLALDYAIAEAPNWIQHYTAR